jgi:hypothetical protein
MNNKDIHDDANWAPCILRKLRKEQLFEILDTNEADKVGDDLEWNSDDGLANDWGMYYISTLVLKHLLTCFMIW